MGMIRKDKNMGKDDVLVNCWRRIWNKKVDSDGSFMHHDVPMTFDFIMDIIKGNKVDTSEYTHLELIKFIDNITRSVDIAKCDLPLITRIVICVNECYEDVDDINTTEDRPNTPKEAQKELLKVLRSILDSSDQIREYIFNTSKYYDILKLDPDEIIAKYNYYIKSSHYIIGDEICMINNPDMRAWITKIEPYNFECLLDDGTVRGFSKADVKRTGRHNVSLGAVLHDNMDGCIILEEDKK